MDYTFYFHEQRNLLASMSYIIDEQKEILANEPNNADKLNTLIDQQQIIVQQLLEMQTDQQTIGSHLTRPNQYTTTRLDVHLKNKAEQFHQRFGCRVICHMRGIVLCTDVEKLLVVIENLLMNAVKYGNKKPIMITANRLDKNRIEIRIIDRGIGIGAADMPHIGEPLFRTKEATQLTHGTGLGVYFSKKILEQLGFELSYSSSEAGTCATILL